LSKRVLAVIIEGQEAIALVNLQTLAVVARAERAPVRLAYFRRLPSPRVDRTDRIVVPAEREMERVEAAAMDALRAATRSFEDIVMEPVVRFGTPGREVRLEAEALGAELVVFLSARGGPVWTRLGLWATRRGLARCPHVRVLVLDGPAPGRSDILTPPRWQQAPIATRLAERGGARPG
jgi:nucleotide-binding universal stress UspA family protein